MAIREGTHLTYLAVGLLFGLTITPQATPIDLRAGGDRGNPVRPAAAQIENPTTSPQATISLEERADIYMARKSFAEAVDYYDRALKQPGLSHGEAAIIWNKMGIAYQQEVNYRAAMKAYQEATRLRPDFAEPWNNLGTTYFMESRFKKSTQYYQRAITLSPAVSSFHMNLGTALYRIKKYKRAVEEYRKALTLDPNILSEHSSIGTVMQTRGADADFYFYLAKSFAAVGRADEAVRYLRRALEDGFKDRNRLDEDPDIQKVSQNPAYIELMKNPPVPIRD